MSEESESRAENEAGPTNVERTQVYRHYGLFYRIVVERGPDGWIGTWQCSSPSCGVKGPPVFSELSADDALQQTIMNTELIIHRYMGHRYE
jgi:hypothetical protein